MRWKNLRWPKTFPLGRLLRHRPHLTAFLVWSQITLICFSKVLSAGKAARSTLWLWDRWVFWVSLEERE